MGSESLLSGGHRWSTTGGDDDNSSPPSLAHVRHGNFIGGFQLSTSLHYLLSIKTCYSSRQFHKGGLFFAASSMALGLCPVLLPMLWKDHGLVPPEFVLFHDTLYTFFSSSRRHVWNVTKVSSFVLSRTAVLVCNLSWPWWLIHQIMGTILT
jgi:hypothetical protein